MKTPLDTHESFATPTGLRSRRIFLVESARVLALATVLAACADKTQEETPSSRRLSASEARTMRAFAARIIPSDDGAPGAEEARAIRFVERAMGMAVFGEMVPLIHEGLADLDSRARGTGARGFAALVPDQQDAVLRQIEHTKFFASARTLVVMGMLADPKYGGNVDGVGWTMIGLEHRPSYTAPFGWYDAQAHADTVEAR